MLGAGSRGKQELCPLPPLQAGEQVPPLCHPVPNEAAGAEFSELLQAAWKQNPKM